MGARLPLGPILGRGLAVWALMMLGESLNGIVRESAVVPALGPERARVVGFAVGCAVILGVATLCSDWLNARSAGARRLVGGFWAALTLGFEAALTFARGLGWDRFAADYDPRRGGLMLFGMALLLAAPTLAARIKDRMRRHPNPA